MATISNLPREPLFYLVVQNRVTHMVSGQRQNANLATRLPDKLFTNHHDFPYGNRCLGVYRPRPDKPRLLATMGSKPEHDIYIRQDADCQFEISDGGFVMLYDRSPQPVISFDIKGSVPFKENGPRRVVIMPEYNEVIHFGEGTKKQVDFRFVWNGTKGSYFNFARETAGLPIICEISEDPEMVEAIVGGPPSVPAAPEIQSSAPSKPRRRSSFGLDLTEDPWDESPSLASPTTPTPGLFGPLSTALDISMGEYLSDPPDALEHRFSICYNKKTWPWDIRHSRRSRRHG